MLDGKGSGMSDAVTSASLSATKRALVAIQEMQERLDAVQRAQNEPIAIVGIGCRFPKAPNLAAFWELLANGVDAVGEVPPDRWDIDQFYDPDPNAMGKIYSRSGAFLEHLDQFDPEFFDISAREAPYVDPRQRLLLESAWEALEDAGIVPATLAGSATGVFIAVITSDYDQLLTQELERVRIYSGIGAANSIVANRLSYFLDLHGPSLVLDTACSGSLTALHEACHSLRAGESTLALVGGVSVNLLPNGDVFFSRAGALSPDGRCQTFDSRANGMVRCEGSGILVLKRLSDAQAAGDRIYAVIRASAVNHDGRSNGIMAPNSAAQVAVLQEAYRRAGIDPAQVQYVETHGTGTRLGDPIEVQSLAEVLGAQRTPDRPVVLGSVKSNLGHPEAAAGVAGIIKVALSMQHRLIPPNLHFRDLNPLIDTPGFAFEIPTELRPWPRPAEPLIAGVDGFGFGGANAHVVLAEAPANVPAEQPAAADIGRSYLLPLSARSPEALHAQVVQMRDFLAVHGESAPLADICHTASLRRSHFEKRLAAVGATAAEFVDRLAALADGDRSSLAAPDAGRASEAAGAVQLAFVFPGQGTQWFGMARRLLDEEPVFRQTIERCDAIFRQYTGWSLRAELQADAGTSRLGEIGIVQPTIFAIQVALADLWRSWGIVPQAVAGQSLGEVAAAYTAGALSLEDAVKVAYYRSWLLIRVAGKGMAAAVGLSRAEMVPQLASFAGQVGIAGSSSPTSCVISGEPEVLGECLRMLESKNIFCRLLVNVDAAAHSPHMEPLKGELMAALRDLTPRPCDVPFFSTVTGVIMDGASLDGAYWARNLREPFDFAGVVGDLIDSGFNAFVEISPHAVLCSAVHQNLAQHGRVGFAVPSLLRDQHEQSVLLASLGALYMAGHAVDWARLLPTGGRFVSLPAYPWQREHYWFTDVPVSPSRAGGRQAGAHPLLGTVWEPAATPGQHIWEVNLDAQTPHYLKDHGILNSTVFPGAGYLEMALAAGEKIAAGAGWAAEDVHFERLMVLTGEVATRVQCVLTPAARDGYEFAIYSRRAGEAWTRHAHGVLRRQVAGTGWSEAVDIDALLARCPESLTIDDLYRDLAERHLRYGPAFRGVTALNRGAGEALSRVELPAQVAPEARHYQLHPALLDACFQGIAAVLSEDEQITYVPQGVDHIRAGRHVGTHAWCHLSARPVADPGAEAMKADLHLYDDDGAWLATVQGLRLQRLDATNATAQHNVRDWLYTLAWRPGPAPESAGDGRHPGRWLILADEGGVGDELARELKALGEQCTVVHAAPAESARHANGGATLDPRDAGAVQAFMAEYATVGRVPWRGLVHLWSLDAPVLDGASTADLDRADSAYAALLPVVQTLASAESDHLPRLWLVTRNAVAIGAEATATLSATQAPLWGIGRVLAREHGELWGGLVDLDGGVGNATAQHLAARLVAAPGETQWAVRNGQWFVPRLVRLAGEMPGAAGGPRLRGDGAYLITGGLTGVGLETARWMVEQGARRLILLSRTELPPRATWRSLDPASPAAERAGAIRQLESMGASIHVGAVDVGDEEELCRFLATYREEGWPAIRGVVHSAAVIRDQLMLNMDRSTFDAALRPKARGAWLLDRLLADEPLDFFVMYSSMTSVMGQYGQANYAAGNAFLDALAHERRRRGQPALSINWGPWGSIGLYARQRLAARAGLTGVGEIEPADGMAILGLLLGLPAAQVPAQVAAIDANWQQVLATPLLAELLHKPADESAGELPAGDALVELLLASAEERQAILQERLRALAARIFRQNEARVNVHAPLTSLGMDSIMAMELKNQVFDQYAVELPIADVFTSSLVQIAQLVAAGLQVDDHLAALLDEVEGLAPEAGG